MRWGVRWTALVALFVTGCSLIGSTPPPMREGRQEGIASWYGPGFHGRRTANGEVYDQYELTAAHPTLRLGSRVMVTSLTNGHAVEVRVNDRGPFVGGRVIDLSFAAARVIGMIGPGTMPVRVEVLDAAPIMVASRRAARPERPRTASDRGTPVAIPVAVAAPEPARAHGAFAVLVATLSDAGKAEHLRSRIALKFPDAHVSPIDVGADRYYRVRIGPYPERPHAVARAELVNRFGYPAVITEDATP